MATQSDVRRIALALPETSESDTRFAFSVRNRDTQKGFVWAWNERVAPKKPRVPNPAFLRARADDLFWGARRLRTIMTDEMIRAAVKAGQYTNPQAADAIARTLIERRDKIVRAWLAGVNPVVDVALAQDGRLTFGNAAVDARVAPAPSSYVATWSRFDNTSSAATAIGETRGASPMTPPAGLPSAVRDFVQVDIRAEGGADPSWAQPVHAWFTRTADGWKLVGFERMP